MATRRNGLLLKLPALDVVQPVMFRQPAVDHDEVGGDEIRKAQVVLEDLVEEQLGFQDHRNLEQVVEFGVKDVAGLRGVNLPQPKPLANEVLRQSGGLRTLKHSLDLGLSTSGWFSSFRLASSNSSSSGMLLQRKYESRLARA